MINSLKSFSSLSTHRALLNPPTAVKAQTQMIARTDDNLNYPLLTHNTLHIPHSHKLSMPFFLPFNLFNLRPAKSQNSGTSSNHNKSRSYITKNPFSNRVFTSSHKLRLEYSIPSYYTHKSTDKNFVTIYKFRLS